MELPSLTRKTWHLSICKINELQIPVWAEESAFLNLTFTPDEQSLICEELCVPRSVKTAEHGWRCFMINGSLGFEKIGVIAAISTILAQQHIAIFVISTYETDYILVKEDTLVTASVALQKAGYEIHDDDA